MESDRESPQVKSLWIVGAAAYVDGEQLLCSQLCSEESSLVRSGCPFMALVNRQVRDDSSPSGADSVTVTKDFDTVADAFASDRREGCWVHRENYDQHR